MLKTAAAIFLMGLSFGCGPCVASCGPILISYIAGTGSSASKGIRTYFLFSASRVLVYAALGIAVFYLGRFAAQERFAGWLKYCIAPAGIFIVAIGALTAFGRQFASGPCKFLYQKLLANDKKSVIILGIIIGILPCAPLIALMGYLALVSRSAHQALFYSFSFGLGTMVSPLLVLSGVAGLIPRFIKDDGMAYQKVLSFICGFIMVYLGTTMIVQGVRALYA